MGEDMTSQYHILVQQAIVRFGNNNKKVARVRHSGQPIHINHPTNSKTILYNPDVHFELKNRKRIIFEIVDTQPDEKTIADVIRSLLSPNASQVYFIVKNKNKEKNVDRIYDVILSKLADDFRTKKSKLPMDANVIHISQSDISNTQRLDDLLKEYITI